MAINYISKCTAVTLGAVTYNMMQKFPLTASILISRIDKVRKEMLQERWAPAGILAASTCVEVVGYTITENQFLPILPSYVRTGLTVGVNLLTYGAAIKTIGDLGEMLHSHEASTNEDRDAHYYQHALAGFVGFAAEFAYEMYTG